MKRNIAVILAGGVGSRLGMSTPKQFFKVAGKMVVEHTVDVFERNSRIDEIAIVSNPMLIADFENIVLRNKWRKVKRFSREERGGNTPRFLPYKPMPTGNGNRSSTMPCDRCSASAR